MKKAFIIILSVIFTLSNHAQELKEVEYFKIQAPDTIQHGSRFEVTYTLKSTNFEYKTHPDFVGFKLCKTSYKTEKGNEKNKFMHTLQYTYELEALTLGSFTLPSNTAIVSNKEVTSTSKLIHVIPNSQYAQELDAVSVFLRQKGIPIEKCQLQLTASKPEYLLFNGGKSDFFILVAREKFHSNLDNPILAYGFEGGLPDEEETFNDIIGIYKIQLNYLYDNHLKYGRNTLDSYHPTKGHVSPLLNKIAWGQKSPYNDLYFNNQADENKKEKFLVGCVPVAMAQIMKSHAHPATGKDSYAYKTRNGNILSQDFNNIPFNWNLMKDSYDAKEKANESSKSVARLMAAAGISVGAEFGKYATGADCNYIKMALTNFFNYSPSCAYIKHQNTITNATTLKETRTILQSPDSILGLSYRELDEGRPFIVSNENHAFVCDGYDGDFLHFNLGWNGYCNGFYRNIIIPGMKEYPLLYNSMIIGIQPDNYTEVTKEIILSESGTLDSLLSENEKQHLHTLIIRGELDGQDMKLIRRMAGAIDDNDYFTWRGELCHLDLSQATFKDEDSITNSYITQNAKEIGLKMTFISGNSKRKTYNFNTLTPQEWNELCESGKNKCAEFIITEENGIYYTHYFMQKNKIGKSQFTGCNNLKSIILPSGLTEIGDKSFWDCHSLRQIHLPSSILKVGKYAFGNTYLLQEVTTDNLTIDPKNAFNNNTYILNKGIIANQ